MGGCAELVMTGKVVTLGGVSDEGWKRGQITAPIALRSGLIGEWSAAGVSGMNVVSGDMGVDGVIVRFVLSTVRPEWS